MNKMIYFLKLRLRSRVCWNRDPLTKALGSVSLECEDASINHDDILYN